LLDEKAIPYRYREYTREPLTEGEIREILRLLGIPARDLLRTKDPAYATPGLAGKSDDALIRAMAHHLPWSSVRSDDCRARPSSPARRNGSSSWPRSGDYWRIVLFLVN
jgi:hypothetical protein